MPRSGAAALLLALLLPGAIPRTTLAAEPADAPTAVLAQQPRLRAMLPVDLPGGTPFPGPDVEVVLQIDVDAQGRVVAVQVLSGAGEPFDSAAVATARRFEFDPALLASGEPVPVRIDFRLRIEPPATPAPPVRYRGLLLERGTRRPLAGVEVAARVGEEVAADAITDASGRFELTVPAPGFQLEALVPGYARLDLSVDALPGEERDETLYLASTGGRFETVVRASPVRREVTRQVVTREFVESAPGTQGDTLKVVQNLPGVARPAFGGGPPILRGSSPGDSRIFLEGQEIPLLYHFGGLRSSFNAAFLDSVEFFPGNFSPEYGRAIGGVIDVRVREPSDDLLRGRADLNVYDAGFNLEGPLGAGWKVGGAFHRSYIDTLLPLALPDDAPLSFDTAPRYYDYQALATWRPDARHRVRLLAYGSMDSLRMIFDRPQEDPLVRGALDARTLFHNLQVAWRSELGSGVTQDTSVLVGTQRIETAIGPDFFFNLAVRRLSLRSTWTVELAEHVEARAGLDVARDGVEIALNSPQRPREGEVPTPFSSQQVVGVSKEVGLFMPGAFADLRLRPLGALELMPGARVDYYGPLRRWAFDPRFAARLPVREGTVLAAGVGLFQQPPQPDESDPDTGNPRLMPERSLQASAGVEQRLGAQAELLVTGFYKKLDRMVVRNGAAAFDASQPRYLNAGTGRILGAELQLRARPLPGVQAWVAYTFQRSFRTDGPGEGERLFDFDQPHILTAIGSVELGRGWSAGARFRLVSGNPATPVLGAVYDAASDTWVPRYGRTNSERLALFHQLDVRVDKRWTFDTWTLGAYLDVQNVYNHGNQEGWRYSYDYTRRQPVTGLPILPIAGVQAEW